MNQKLLSNEEDGRHKQSVNEGNQVKPGLPVSALVSNSASRLVLVMSRVELPTLSVGRATRNIFLSSEDMPLADLARLIDNEPRFKLNLINMLSVQLEMGRCINSIDWPVDRIPIFTSQNSRHLNLMAAGEHSKAINRKLSWNETTSLNKLSATIFLSKLVCEILPSLVLLAKIEYLDGDERKSCQTLGELLPIIKHMGELEDWHQLSKIDVIPADGKMSLQTVLRTVGNSVDLRLKTQVVSAIRLLAHWKDVVNKVTFILKQMPSTTLFELQKDWLEGKSEQDLSAKVFIDSIHVNEYMNLSVFIPRIFNVNSVSLITSGEMPAEIRYVRLDGQREIIDNLVSATYAGSLVNDKVDARVLTWEMQMRCKRLRPTLAKQILLCDPDTTLENVVKELRLELDGKVYTSLLTTNIEWKFNPEHKVNEWFEGDFKLVTRFGDPVCVQMDQPLNPNIPVCLDLELSGQQWRVDEQAMEEMRMEHTPGILMMLDKFGEEVSRKHQKILDNQEEVDNVATSISVAVTSGFERCFHMLGDTEARMSQDGLCDETAKLGVNDDEAIMPMDIEESGKKSRTSGKRK